MTSVAVKPDLLRWAVERSGLEEEELIGRFPKLPEWVSGERQPTVTQLRDFASRTMVPFGYFFLPRPPEDRVPLSDFRTKGNRGVPNFSPELAATLKEMEGRKVWMREYLMAHGARPLDFVGSLSIALETDLAADRILYGLNLSRGWGLAEKDWSATFRKLRDAADTAGVLVAVSGVVGSNTSRHLDPNEFRGFVLIDEYAPVVFVNGADTDSARLFTLAHELVHVWLGRASIVSDQDLQTPSDDVEQFCNRVAAELLLPAVALKSSWSQLKATRRPFDEGARRFKISPMVVARKAYDLGLIDLQEMKRFNSQYMARWNSLRDETVGRKSQGNFYTTLRQRTGLRFSQSVINSVLEGRTTFNEGSRLLGVRGEAFVKYAERLGIPT